MNQVLTFESHLRPEVSDFFPLHLVSLTWSQNIYRMLVISHHLTTGQITFILRAGIQVLSYGGLFLIGLIILSCAPAQRLWRLMI